MAPRPSIPSLPPRGRDTIPGSLPLATSWSDRIRGDAEEPLLDRTLRLLRRRKWIILQALVAIPLLVLLFSLQQDKRYTATASLLFTTSQLDSGPVDLTRQATTNEELLQLPAVAERTARALGGGLTRTQVRDSIEVKTEADSDIVEIAATAATPRLAADMANRYGESFVAFRREAQESEIERRIEIYERAYDALPPEEQQGERGQTLRERLDRLRISQELSAAQAVGAAELVQRASLPRSASSPRIARNLVLAVLLALVVGVGLAALRDRVDRALTTEDELERVFALPILARLPRVRSFGKRLQQHSLAGSSSTAQVAEALKTLRANLRYFSVDRELRSILVASPIAGDGKSSVAAGLAMTMAQMGDSVVLVEADLHKEHSSEAFAEPSHDGLSTVLAGAVALEEALTVTSVFVDAGDDPRSLTVLRSGPIPPNASKLMESERMRSLVAELEERFDTVIIDSPPLAVVSDALALVQEVSGVLVVSRLGHTEVGAAVEFRNQLAMLDAPALGVVANFSGSKPGASYYYGR